MKNKLIATLVLLIAFLCFIPNVFAEEYAATYEAVITSENTEYKPGDKVVVELRVKNVSEDVEGTSAAISFDSSVLSLIGQNVKDNRRSGYINTVISQDEEIDGLVAFAKTSGGVFFDGDYLLISTLTFEVKEGASGTTTIEAQVKDPVDMYNNYLKAQGNTVTIKFSTPLKSISLEASKSAIGVGEKLTINPIYTPSTTTDSKDVKWSSSDETVATVSNGVVTAKTVGTATITAQSIVEGVAPATFEVTVTQDLQSITLNKTNVELKKGINETLTVVFAPVKFTTPNVTIEWSSSDETVAKVSNGVVTTFGYGKATITAKALSNGDALTNVEAATCEVSVTNHVTGINLDKENEKLVRGKTLNLVATLIKEIPEDETTDTGSIVWTTDNSNVTVVDGVVTGVSKGVSKVTATFGEYSKTATIEVYVPVESISIGDDITLRGTESKDLIVTPNPIDADNFSITWESGDANIVAVVDGKITGVNPGTTTVTAKVSDENFATVNVTVLEVKVEKITIENGIGSIELARGEEQDLKVSFEPTDATNKALTWTSSDESVASVTDGKVKALKAGSAIITAKNGDITDTITINVIVPLESIAFDEANITINKDESKTLTYSTNPIDTMDDSEVTFTSSDESVVTVTNTGSITGIAAGTATITIQKGEKTDTVEVTVNSPLKSISANDLEVKVNKTENIVVTYLDSDTTDSRDVTYEVLDSSIASVTSDGVVTGLNVGTTTITIKSVVSGVEPITITVNVPSIPLTGIKVSSSVSELLVGDETNIKVTYLTNSEGDATTDKLNISYSSSDTDVVEIVDGMVIAKGLGSAKVTIIVNDFTETLDFEVVEPIIKEVEYNIIEIDDEIKSDGDYSVRIDADVSKFYRVLVDGVEISSDNYTVKSGSTIVTLNSDYLKTLSAGVHTMTVEFMSTSGITTETGEVTTSFTIPNEIVTSGGEKINPQTGDSIILYMILSLISMIGLVTGSIYFKKSNR